MYNDTQMVLEALGFVLAIGIPVGTIIWNDARNKERARQRDEALNTKIDTTNAALNTKIDNVIKVQEDIQKTIGDGGYQGIKHDIRGIERNCADKMGRVEEQIAHIKRARK